MKGRTGKGYRSRRINTRKIRQRFLIVCEGERTEPNYFDSFRTAELVIQVEGLGIDPMRLVERTVLEREQGDYNQVWCVFDRDEVFADRFNGALARAKQQKIRVAYSNPAFELWYVLHFQDCNSSLTRQDYCRLLSGHLGREYDKRDLEIPALLGPHTQAAIQRAERLLRLYQPHRPADDDPATTVHELVKELLRFSGS